MLKRCYVEDEDVEVRDTIAIDQWQQVRTEEPFIEQNT
jgi:hypothetical protein